jgi:glycosyltransferase involved in cell wall biosynthesis
VDGVTGLLVEKEDPMALASAIETLLSQPALASEYGTAARERTLSRFTGSRCVDAYEQVYRELIGETVHVDVG